MGCSGSKDTVQSVKKTIESDQFQAAVTKAKAAALSASSQPTETEQAQQELRERIEANDHQRRKLEKTRTDKNMTSSSHPNDQDHVDNKKKHKNKKKKSHESTSSSDSDSSTSSSSSSKSSETAERSKKKKKTQKSKSKGSKSHEVAAEATTPKPTPPLSPSASRRGYVDAQQKDDVRSHYAATLGGVGGGGGGLASPRAAAAASSTNKDHDDDVAMERIDEECGDDEALLLLKEIILRARHERDGALAELKRVSAERDASREEYAYLRATADASDNFENVVRIPPNWSASEQRLIDELRQRNAALEQELTVIRYQLRRKRFMSTERPALVQLLSTTSSSGVGGGGASPTTMQTPGLLMSSSSSAFGGAGDNGQQLLPLSPTELASSVRSLQARYVSAEQEVQRVESFHRQAHANAQQEAAALHQQSQELRHSISHLEKQHRDYSEATKTLAEKIHAMEEVLKKRQAELASVVEATAKEAANAERHKAEAAAATSSAAEAIATAAEATASAAAEHAALNERREQERNDLALRADQKKLKEQSDTAQFLRQVSRLLINAEHCSDEVRLQLLQFVCEHGGLPVEGRETSRLVADPTEFDMNGILYGDAIAYLASLVISRPACRIESLILSETAMTDLGCAQLALTLAVLPFETTLRHMNLSNNELTARGVTQLLTALQSSALCAGIGGRPTMITQRLAVDLDNNPAIFQTVEDVQLVTSQVESMKKTVPLVEVFLPRLPKLEQLMGKTAQSLRSSSVFVPPPLGT